MRDAKTAATRPRAVRADTRGRSPILGSVASSMTALYAREPHRGQALCGTSAKVMTSPPTVFGPEADHHRADMDLFVVAVMRLRTVACQARDRLPDSGAIREAIERFDRRWPDLLSARNYSEHILGPGGSTPGGNVWYFTDSISDRVHVENRGTSLISARPRAPPRNSSRHSVISSVPRLSYARPDPGSWAQSYRPNVEKSGR
jgi:hypothetical protein